MRRSLGQGMGAPLLCMMSECPLHLFSALKERLHAGEACMRGQTQLSRCVVRGKITYPLSPLTVLLSRRRTRIT